MPAIAAYLDAIDGVGWIVDVWLAGSVVGGDHRPGRQRYRLVAITMHRLSGP